MGYDYLGTLKVRTYGSPALFVVLRESKYFQYSHCASESTAKSIRYRISSTHSRKLRKNPYPTSGATVFHTNHHGALHREPVVSLSGAYVFVLSARSVWYTPAQWCGTPQRSGVGHVPISLREKAVLTMDSHADILLVEDEPDIVDLMERILRRAGYTVRAVTDGLAALTAMSVLPPAVMILDLVLPGMSGWAVLDELHRDQCQVPIIIMTANPCVSARLSGYGIQQYLVKPFLMDELLGSIADVYPLQRHR